jgi:hypothetical protein
MARMQPTMARFSGSLGDRKQQSVDGRHKAGHDGLS